MTSHLPPVPPANRTDKGPGDTGTPPNDPARGARRRPDNTAEQGKPGNTHQNTTNQGYQQDR